ncbi:hypothetical protein WME94_40375 [Sorangium sp. So ce429]
MNVHSARLARGTELGAAIKPSAVERLATRGQRHDPEAMVRIQIDPTRNGRMPVTGAPAEDTERRESICSRDPRIRKSDAMFAGYGSTTLLLALAAAIRTLT